MEYKALRYNKGKLRYDLLPHKPLQDIVDVYTRGAHKYTTYAYSNGKEVSGKDISLEDVARYGLKIVYDGADNWRLGQDWMSSIGSIKRHIESFVAGEDFDPEIGTYHLANAAWGLMALLEFYKTHPELDNRRHKYLSPVKIGLDIDEVICDFVGGMMEKFPNDIKDVPTFWNCPALGPKFNEVKHDVDFWMGLQPKINPANVPFEPHCYITSRTIDTDTTKAWLDANGFPSAPIYTIPHGASKVEIAKQSGVEWFVDDRYENFVELNNAGICCFLFDAPHNHKYDVGYKRIKTLKDLV